ncbi:MAG: helix-turn-helix transcriptional regulator [Bacteroidales bacterium]|nr:helix-turn-helix transcriptional regulator [Bacteroidales bacterium]
MILFLSIMLGLFVCATGVFLYLFLNRQFKLKRVWMILKRQRALPQAADFVPACIPSGKDSLVSKLKDAFDKDKVYLDETLTLESLAHKLDTNRTTLSRVINRETGRSFSELLGDYRVKEALTLLNDSAYNNYTIEAIGELSGFSSRQVFHRAFKKRIGVPPRRFR